MMAVLTKMKFLFHTHWLLTILLDAGTSNVQERNALLLHAIGGSFNVESEHRGYSYRSATNPA